MNVESGSCINPYNLQQLDVNLKKRYISMIHLIFFSFLTKLHGA